MPNPPHPHPRAAAEPHGAAPDHEELLARLRRVEAERDRLREEADISLAALRESERHIRALADAAPAILWLTDTANRCTFLSRRWYDFTGQTEDEALGTGWLDAVHADDRDEAVRRFHDAAGRREPFSIDHRLRRSDGSYRWVVDEGRPRYNEAGQWRGYIGSVIDVHDRSLAADALCRSEARYRALFDAIDEGFCVLHILFDDDDRPVDYRFLEANSAFVGQTGLENAIGRTARELLPDLEEHWFETYGRVARTGKAIRFEAGSDVMRRWFDVFAFRIEEPEQHKVALLFTDVTDRKRAEAERERLLHQARAASAEAEEANRSKAEFLAAMSHELRTPLNAIGGYVELLDVGIYGELSAEQRTALARVTSNQRHLLTLINDILSFARIEAGSFEINSEPLSARDVLAGLEPLVAPTAEAKGVVYALGGCDDVRFRGDAERVRQILLNLVGNAIKFTSAGGRVDVSCDADDDAVYLRVSDTGVGIPAAQQERIFDAFQQIGRRLNQPQEGVGLGLAISRDLAHAMNGELSVESAPDVGSTFTLRLPREHDDAA